MSSKHDAQECCLSHPISEQKWKIYDRESMLISTGGVLILCSPGYLNWLGKYNSVHPNFNPTGKKPLSVPLPFKNLFLSDPPPTPRNFCDSLCGGGGGGEKHSSWCKKRGKNQQQKYTKIVHLHWRTYTKIQALSMLSHSPLHYCISDIWVHTDVTSKQTLYLPSISLVAHDHCLA